MKKFLTVLFMTTINFCNGQNLIFNPSFEDTLQCPDSFDQINYSNGWSGFSSEYFNSCNTNLTEVMGYQSAATGDGFAGLITFMDTSINYHYREFVQTSLTTPLVPGVKYYASMKASLAGTSIMASSNIGLLFSTYIIPTNLSAPNCNCSQIYSSNVISDTLNWTIISGSFIADSAYQYVIVGNFFDNQNTIFTGSNSTAYYFIDDICITTDSLGCDIVTKNKKKNTNENLNSFPNPFNYQLTFTSIKNVLVRITLFDILGQQISQNSFYNNLTINTEQLSKGIYIYSIIDDTGESKTGKIVKE